MLTTIDENAGLELYISVPVAQAPGLKIGLPVRIVDDRAKLIATDDGQLHLAVGRLRDAVRAGEGAARRRRAVPHRSVRAHARRLEQRARASRCRSSRWSASTASTSSSSSRRARTARPSRGSAPVQLGPVIGNDYVVLGGLKAGEQLDRLRHPEDRRRHAGAGRRGRRRRRPRAAGGGRCSPNSSSAGRSWRRSARCSSSSPARSSIPILPIARYPELAPPSVDGRRRSTPAPTRSRSKARSRRRSSRRSTASRA